MKARLPLVIAVGIFLSASTPLSADLTYYYNSLDTNPYDFTGILTLPSYFPGSPLPILTFSLSAVVSGETLNFTTADQAGPAEALYDTNPSDPLHLLFPYPSYGIVDPVLGGQEVVLGGAPAAFSLGAPMIYDVPSSPVTVDASDNGVWLLTPPTGSTATPEPSGVSLFALLALAFTALCFAHRRRRNNRPHCAG